MLYRKLPETNAQDQPSPKSFTAPAEKGFPVRAAAIDVGSNAIRFIAAEFSAPARYTVLEQMRAPVRLGHGVFVSGKLTPDAMVGDRRRRIVPPAH